MRTYEALYIAKPELKDDEIQTIASEVENMVGQAGGSIVRSEIWGKRRLAYEVDGFAEGAYVLLRFQAQPAFVAKLENHFRLTENIIRYITVHFDEKTLRLEEQQKKRVEEQIRASAAAANRDDDDDDDDLSGPVYRGRGDRDDDD
ncbi:MAG: 30S ribosomal protein S6 [Candidatus Hydrogenedentes bacterium]|nr:30S ribosomal protein S6 [Candidatus Hydrogenedentota bacterium]